MDFTINSQYLLHALSNIKGVILSKNTISILDNYLFEITNDTLKVTASDLETFVSTFTQISSNESGSVCVNAKKLNDILGMLKSQDITLSFKDNYLEIKTTIGKYKIPTESANEYPKCQGAEQSYNNFVTYNNTIIKGINTTSFAVSDEEARPVLTAIHIDSNNSNIRFTATDSHKLSRYTANVNANIPNLSINLSVKAATLLSKLLTPTEDNESVSVFYNNDFISISNNLFSFYSRLIEGNYPDCDRVIPNSFQQSAMFTKSVLYDSIKRVSYFSNSATNMIVFNIANNVLNLSAQDFEQQSSANESININPSTTEEPANITIGFKSKYIIDSLDKLITDEVTIKMNSPMQPAVIVPSIESDNESYLMLCMPMAIN